MLQAGTYTTAPFSPAFTFTIDTAWNNDRAMEEGGGISAQTGAINWIAGTAEAWIGAEEMAIASADDVATYIELVAGEEGYTVGESTSVTIGGVEGMYVDFVRSALNSTGGGFVISEDRFVYEPGGQSRVYFLPTEGGWTFLVVEGDDERFAALMNVAQPVLDSIAWE